MTQTSKAIALVSAFGAIGGAGAYAGGLFSNKSEEKENKPAIVKTTISSKLAREGFQVLDTNKDDGWDEVLTVYRNATEKSFSKQKEASKTKEELKQECLKILNKEEESGSNYALAKQWCVKKEKMDAILNRIGLKLLKFSEPENQEEKPLWTEKVKELKKDKKRFSAIEGNIKEVETETDGNIKALKAGCKNLKTDTLDTTSDEFANNFELTKEWCSTSK